MRRAVGMRGSPGRWRISTNTAQNISSSHYGSNSKASNPQSARSAIRGRGTTSTASGGRLRQMVGEGLRLLDQLPGPTHRMSLHQARFDDEPRSPLGMALAGDVDLTRPCGFAASTIRDESFGVDFGGCPSASPAHYESGPDASQSGRPMHLVCVLSWLALSGPVPTFALTTSTLQRLPAVSIRTGVSLGALAAHRRRSLANGFHGVTRYVAMHDTRLRVDPITD